MKSLWLGTLVLAAFAHDAEVILRSNTRLVTVDVVVRDKEGKPFRGLTASDFTLIENGKKQK